MLFLDARRLRRVFFNLVRNATDVMPGGGKIFLRFHADEKEIVTEIEDTGPGIAPEIAGKLFQPFVTHRQGPRHRPRPFHLQKNHRRPPAAASGCATNRTAARFFASRCRWQNNRCSRES